jgi:hypothetical protein
LPLAPDFHASQEPLVQPAQGEDSDRLVLQVITLHQGGLLQQLKIDVAVRGGVPRLFDAVVALRGGGRPEPGPPCPIAIEFVQQRESRLTLIELRTPVGIAEKRGDVHGGDTPADGGKAAVDHAIVIQVFSFKQQGRPAAEGPIECRREEQPV